ncbi:MAG: proline dehydrogenase family protein [Bacteroidota bacterium]
MELSTKVSFEDTSIAFSAKSNQALRKAHFLFAVIDKPLISKLSIGMVKIALKLRLPIGWIIKRTVFEHFCGGETINDSQPSVDQLAEFNIGTVLDYSVEGEKNEAGFDRTVEETLRTIEKAGSSDNMPFCVFKATGLASSELLEKVQMKEGLTEEETSAFQRVRERIDRLCKAAHDHDVAILVDAEETWMQGTIDMLAYEMMEKYNQNKAIVYNTYQMYRADMFDNLKSAFHYAAMNNYYLGAKLVRGAYMEKERGRAEDRGYPNPIHPDKSSTDDAFNKGLEFCINNKQRVHMMCGSHNEYSNHYLTLLMDKHSMTPNDPRVWFAQLYGMSDNISFNLAKGGYNVAKYVPYGPVLSVMPYLFRRAKENTSVAGQSGRELMLLSKELKRRKHS